MSPQQAISPERSNHEALSPGCTLLSGQYEIIRYLSSGGFGITYLARDSLNRTVVIKECFPEAFCSRVNRTVRARTENYADDFRSIVKLFIREAHALSRLDHSSVVGVHQVFEDNETAYMALDLVEGKDLLDIIESGQPVMRPQQIQALTLKLLDAIAHVHKQDLLHRDISPDNILLEEGGRPVLIDFGAAREEASRKSRVLSAVLVVKDGYSPQEFYVAGSQQYPCSDLYALAATLVHLITGEPPPNSQARLAALASKHPDLYVPLKGRFSDYDDAFLEAIDTSMSIIPSDRLQSAEDWILMIDHSKRIEIARERARDDKNIDVKVMNLVKTTNVHVMSERVVTPSETASEQTIDLKPKREVEDLTPKFDLRSLAIREPETNTPEPLTPYVRVKSKAIEEQQDREKEREEQEAAGGSVPRLSRIATVPVVFCTYFFYAHIALQFDAVHAATVQPIVDLSTELVEMRKQPPKVIYRQKDMGL